ncbi:hypothetical protein SDRG_01353 [Saprolegnia diclina VS20]|uniref:J domain-containing protein n=1 Tax=Saprolegnia diclina (strain VS20) TaxID=1156394 RepID=T0SEN7_SAPDV|nr:hypothetical protein SDRG_01353 [Saprolegnia diclina VS20]EQC41382.1 hypothetical protein SDRG_01353 [Saprolegnia diclina VS20]|eukprot:XP_008605096.1 hypothetical protein SDRG_01353 [Saprolegnia diclina VS20]
MDDAGGCEVARILGARHHFAVLGLDRVEFADLATVRRQYKLLARVVHPDKSAHAQAEDAFKKLSIAYECLADDASQTQYLASITSSSKKRRRGQSNDPPAKRPAPTTHIRMRTPDEIYAAFMAEEERQAAAEFQKHGFERVFIASPKHKTKRVETPLPTPEDHRREALLATDLEAKRGGWASFASGKPPNTSEAPAPSIVAPPQVVTPAFHCLLCRRKFKSRDVLVRHEAESELHQANLAKQAQRAT